MASLLSEFDGVVLGDMRLDRRLRLLVDRLSGAPELSLPEALGSGPELEGAYRFLRNPAVDPGALLEPHVWATEERLDGRARVLVVHDTTEFRFGGRSARAGLGLVGTKGQGFYGHFSLALSADGRREPLGVLGIRTWTRADKKGDRDTAERRKEPLRESKRWLEQSVAVEGTIEGPTLIHIEDREGDIYESLAERLAREMHFIVRATGNRVVEAGDGYEAITDHMRSQPPRMTLEIELSKRNPERGHKQQRAHPPRTERSATVEVRAKTVVLRRPKVDGATVRPTITLNAVHVTESNPPEGEPPVDWLLWTTEPIDGTDELNFIIEAYRARWTIEEYFKALKTGCAYEAKQLESLEALQRALSIYAVIAWRLLWLRFIERTSSTTAAATCVQPGYLAVLHAQGRIGPSPTVADFLRAVAELGGHIRRNGPPGWQVIWRGYRSLELLAAGWALRSDQS